MHMLSFASNITAHIYRGKHCLKKTLWNHNFNKVCAELHKSAMSLAFIIW